MNTTPKDITVRDLALELGQPMSVVLSSASSLFAHRDCPVPVFADRGQDKSEWVLSAAAAQRIRSHFPAVVVAPARTGMGSPATKRPSAPGPVTVGELAEELGNLATLQDVVHRAGDMEHAHPRQCQTVYLDYRGERQDRKLSGEAADIIWSALTGQDHWLNRYWADVEHDMVDKLAAAKGQERKRWASVLLEQVGKHGAVNDPGLKLAAQILDPSLLDGESGA